MATLKESAVQSETLFRVHFFLWRILGNLPTKNYRQLYIFYSVLVNTLITICFPLHLVLGLFKTTSMYETINNFTVVLTCLCCSIKTIGIWLRFEHVRKMYVIIKRQDERIALSQDESLYYNNVVVPAVSKIMLVFKVLFAGVVLSAEVAVITHGFFGKSGLMYPAYFPFDRTANSWNNVAAHVYQSLGVCFQILQNLVNDTFTGMHLALLSGQVHILGMRVANIGHNRRKTNMENNQELLACVQDHKDLLQYRFQLEQVVSRYMFLQILFTSINMCATVVFIILYTRDPVTLVHFTIYLICMPAQILPACYYGSVMESAFKNQTYGLFSANWMDQDKMFKNNLKIFAEQTKKPRYMMAWLVRINLTSFLAACKNAYSLFAVVMSMK